MNQRSTIHSVDTGLMPFLSYYFPRNTQYNVLIPDSISRW